MVSATAKGTFLIPSQVDTHGPRLGAIVFSVVGSDSTLGSDLVSGLIQGPEWTFQATTYNSLLHDCTSLPTPVPGCVKLGKTLGYTYDGIVFNVLEPIVGTLAFRSAIQSLTNYAQIQTISLHGISGSAAPYLLPCVLYPSTCITPAVYDANAPAYSYSLHNAVVWLAKSGLNMTYNGGATCYTSTASELAKIATLTTAEYSKLAWYGPSGSILGNKLCTNVFAPIFYWRSDDPLRSSVANLLAGVGGAASLVGLSFTPANYIGIPDASAGGDVYGPSFGAVTGTGGFCAPGATNYTVSNAGTNQCPSATTATWAAAVAGGDDWAMYTYGWVASSAFTFQDGSLFNSQYMAYGGDFGNFKNIQMDYEENCVLYNQTIAGSEACGVKETTLEARNLPVLVSFYENYLYAEYVVGWTGYAAEPTTGPNTVGGAYYNFLNVQCIPGTGSCNSLGTNGVYNYALHSQADEAGLNPMYGVNWVWQADVWSEFYDSPLATPPTEFTVPGAYFNYQVTNVQTAMVPSATLGGTCGKGWFSEQTVNPCASVVVTNGENVTYTFANNVTFSDNVQLTAYDLNATLYAEDVAYPPGLPSVCTPFCGGLAGPFGLLGTYINPHDPYQITMVMGDQSYWNIVDLALPILPAHVFQWFNLNTAFTYKANIDMTLDYDAATGAVTGSTKGTAPLSVLDLPNVEVGSGPYWLLYYTGEGTASAVGQMNANRNYFRTAWWDTEPLYQVRYDGVMNITTPLSEYVYNNPTDVMAFSNPVGSPTAPASGADGYVNMTNTNLALGGGSPGVTCSALLQGYTGPLPKIGKLPASVHSVLSDVHNSTSDTGISPVYSPLTGDVSITIVPSQAGLTKNYNYEVTLHCAYNFLGQPRSWYQFFGARVLSTSTVLHAAPTHYSHTVLPAPVIVTGTGYYNPHVTYYTCLVASVPSSPSVTAPTCLAGPVSAPGTANGHITFPSMNVPSSAGSTPYPNHDYVITYVISGSTYFTIQSTPFTIS